MQRKHWCSLLLLFLIPAVVFAQSGKIRGTVLDAKTKEPLIGANVVVEATNMGASTDVDGAFLIINVPVGTYTIKASYVGYRTLTLANVRVNVNLTSEANFELSSEDVQVQTVEIIGERPLINKSATGAVRIIDNEFFAKLPSRGINAAITLQPGVVERGGNFYIRGGRPDETGFSIDGVNVTNVVGGGRNVSITAEALEQVQVLTGGYTAEFGGATSGLIRSELRTGSERWKLGVLFETDNYTGQNTKSLGGYSYGYWDVTATAGGPILPNLRFFGTVQNTYFTDANVRFWEGYDFKDVRMFATFTPKHPGPGSSDAITDTVDIISPAGNAQGGENNRLTMTGTLSFALSKFQIRAGGSYSMGTFQNTTFGANMFNMSRLGKGTADNGFGSVKVTSFLTPTMFLEASVNYTFSFAENYDPDFGPGADNIWKYGDSTENAKHGYTLRGDSWNFPAYQIILGTNTAGIGELAAFNQAGTQINGYTKNSTTSLGGRADMTMQLTKQFEVKFGGEYQYYTYRQFNPASTFNWARDYKDVSLSPNDKSLTGKLAKKLRGYGPNNLGYDVFGNELDEDLKYGDAVLEVGARHPVFGAGYVQSKLEMQDIVLNLGLRLDYISSDGLDLTNERNVTFSDSLAALKQTAVESSPGHMFVSPRVGFSFPVTDRTVFYTQYGRFVQQPRLLETYRGLPLFYQIIKGGFFYQNPMAFGVRPQKTTSYEIGFQQQLGENASFDVAAFYKDIVDQVTYISVIPEGGATHQTYAEFVNGDFSTTKGLEFKFTLRRTNRLQASANYTLSDARGTGSTPNAQAGAWGAYGGDGPITPKYIVPLNFNQAHRGNIAVDYRFAKDDGGAVLEQMGVNILAQFGSGTNFTRIYYTSPDNAGDPRFRRPIEEIGASSTPWTFQIDARLDKTFSLGIVDLNVYLYVINILNAENPTAVFTRTGDPKNDGYFGIPEGRARAAEFGTDAELYKQMYQTFNGGLNGGTFGPPRQIRFGVRVDY